MATEDPHSNPHAARLALKLVEEHFGELCKKLVAALLGHGVQTFPELLRTSGLPVGQLKSALLVMIQHNCVNCFLHEEPPTLRGPGPSYQLYEAATDRILQIVRIPRFMTHIRDELGEVEETVVRRLLEYGRLRAEQLVQAVLSAQGAEEGGDSEGALPTVTAASLHCSFNTLVQKKYVERVPPCTLPQPPKELHPALIKKKKKSSSLKTTAEEEEAQQRQRTNALKHQAYQLDRFKVPGDLAEGMGLDPEEAAAAKKEAGGGSNKAGPPEGEGNQEEGAAGGKKGGKGAAGGAKRKRGAKVANEALFDEPAPKKRGRKKVKADEEVKEKGAGASAAGEAGADAAGPSSAGKSASASKPAALAAPEPAAELAASEILWRVNYDEFNRKFRNEEVVNFIGSKHGAEAAAAIAAMLIANSRFESGVRIAHTAVLGDGEIKGATRWLDSEEYQIPSDVPAVLKDLEEDPLGLLVFQGSGPHGPQYLLDIAGVLQMVRLSHLDSVIRDRFGGSGMRIWKALLLHKQLEQKQVSDFAMLPKEQARQLLYQMVKAGYLSVQDVPRTADHAPSRTFYTFRANYDLAAARLAADLYRAAGNVHARLAAELAANKEVLELLELVTDGQAPRSALEAHEGKLAVVKRNVTLLQASLLHLDQQIALFNDM